MKIAIEAQRLFRKKKHGMDIVALELIDGKSGYFSGTEQRKCCVLRQTNNFCIIEI